MGATNPAKVCCLKLGPGNPKKGIEGHAATDRPEYAAIFRRDFREPVRQPQAARALHVFGYHRWIAGNVLTEMAGQHSGVKVIAATDAVADVKFDGLAFKEFRWRLGI